MLRQSLLDERDRKRKTFHKLLHERNSYSKLDTFLRDADVNLNLHFVIDGFAVCDFASLEMTYLEAFIKKGDWKRACFCLKYGAHPQHNAAHGISFLEIDAATRRVTNVTFLPGFEHAETVPIPGFDGLRALTTSEYHSNPEKMMAFIWLVEQCHSEIVDLDGIESNLATLAHGDVLSRFQALRTVLLELLPCPQEVKDQIITMSEMSFLWSFFTEEVVAECLAAEEAAHSHRNYSRSLWAA